MWTFLHSEYATVHFQFFKPKVPKQSQVIWEGYICSELYQFDFCIIHSQNFAPWNHNLKTQSLDVKQQIVMRLYMSYFHTREENC